MSWWSTRSPVRFLSHPGRKEGGIEGRRIISFYSPASPFVPSSEVDVAAVPRMSFLGISLSRFLLRPSKVKEKHLSAIRKEGSDSLPPPFYAKLPPVRAPSVPWFARDSGTVASPPTTCCQVSNLLSLSRVNGRYSHSFGVLMHDPPPPYHDTDRRISSSLPPQKQRLRQTRERERISK